MKTSTKKVVCKYGSRCYRKNASHLKEFSHPGQKDDDSETLRNDSDEDLEEKVGPSAKKKARIHDFFQGKRKTEKSGKGSCESKEPDKKTDATSDKKTKDDGEAGCDSCGDPKEDIKKRFLVEMPEDFYQFWEFAKSLNSSQPEEAFVPTLGLRLVGPFELLGVNRPTPAPASHLCHYRCYYDPPEFLTVVAGDEKTQFHMGYFRDDPNEFPVFVASNEPKKNCVITPCGGNIFSAFAGFISRRLKRGKSAAATSLRDALAGWAAEHDVSLDARTAGMRARAKTVVSRTFHGAGLVVPVDANEVGYRPLSETPGDLRRILAAMASAASPAERDTAADPLAEMVTLVQFANDEGDYGTGVELGLDLFAAGDAALHPLVLSLLPMGYRLLGRDAFASVVGAHLADRRRAPRPGERFTRE